MFIFSTTTLFVGDWADEVGLFTEFPEVLLNHRKFINDELESEQVAEIPLWDEFIDNRLGRVLTAQWWMDSSNMSVIHGLTKDQIPWPARWFVGRGYLRHLSWYFELRKDVFKEAEVAFDALSKKLGDKKYLLSATKPSTVDCLLFSYLAAMLYVVVPDRCLAKTLKRKHKNLVRYTDRILEEWFKIDLKTLQPADDTYYGEEEEGEGEEEEEYDRGREELKRKVVNYAFGTLFVVGLFYMGKAILTEQT